METGQFPNRITLYRRAIIDYWAEHEETLGDIITHVLIHEIGHHFGLSDDDMERIEASVEHVGRREAETSSVSTNTGPLFSRRNHSAL